MAVPINRMSTFVLFAFPFPVRRTPTSAAIVALAVACVALPLSPRASAQVIDGQTPAASDNLSADDIIPPQGTGTRPVLSDPPPVAPDVPDPANPDAAPMNAADGMEPAISDDSRSGLSADPPAAAGVAGPGISEGSYYGPPRPKAHKGALPAIGWTEPDAHVPAALEEAVNLVTTNYPSARAARAALRAAASDVKAAKWLRFPSIQGNLAYLDSSSSPEPQVVVEAPIWSGGRIGSNIRRARALEDVSSAEYVETVEQLALTVTQAYFEVARLTIREQLLEQSLGEHNRLVETMQRRVDQEISPQADLELARSRAAQIEQEYTVSQSQRRTTLRILAELIADPTFELGPIPYYNEDMDLSNRDALEEQAVAFDPGLQRLRGETDVARAELDTRRAALFPQVNAQYSYDDIFGSRVGVVVRSQTTGGLSQFSEVNSARLRIQSALESTRVAEQQLRRDVSSAIIQYEAARARARISQTSASTAASVSASYTRQFIAGRRSWLDVMNALREAVNAEIGRSDAEFTAMATATQLLLQSGRWRPIFDGEQPNTN